MQVDLTLVKEEIEIDDTKIKLEPVWETTLPSQTLAFSSSNDLKIIEELPDMITVPVNEKQSEDERQFIDSFAMLDQQQLFACTTTEKICFYCGTKYYNGNDLIQHKINSACTASWQQKFKCTVCFFGFVSQQELDSHNFYHRVNKHFCRVGCGDWFDTLEACLEHEYRGHSDEQDIRCRLCQLLFNNMDLLNKHMETHSFFNRYVCALCRRKFKRRQDLVMHRKYSTAICGQVEYLKELKDVCEKVTIGGMVNAAPPARVAINAAPLKRVATLLTIPEKRFKSEVLKLSDIEIKHEPVDIEEQLSLNTILKTEALDKEEHNIVNNNNNSSRCLNENQKGIPHKSKLRLPSIKPAPGVQITTKALKPAPMSVLKNQIKSEVLPIGSLTNIAKSNAPNILKALPSNFMVINLPANTKIVKIPSVSPTNNGSLKSANISATPTTVSASSPAVTITKKLPTNNNGMGVVAETASIKKELQQVSEVYRNACFSSDTFELIDNLPESRKIIQDFQSQILDIEKTLPLPGSVLQKSKVKSLLEDPYEAATELENYYAKNKTKPTSIMLNIDIHGNLFTKNLSRRYPDYRFVWICPSCPKKYNMCQAFRMHLNMEHKMDRIQYANMLLELRPIKLSSKNTTIIEDYESEETFESARSVDTNNTKITKNKESEKNVKENKQDDKAANSVQFADNTKTSSGTSSTGSQSLATVGTNQRYHCLECLKSYTTASALNIHKLIHTGELPHKCNYCEKRFRTRGQVRVHHRRHTGEKPFKCKICSLAFTHRETLISHLSRHIGMKRYKCYGCDKYFVVVSGLRAHRKLRPDTCGKVKFTARAHGPRVRVIRGEVIFEPHPVHNGYLRSEDPLDILSEMNQPKEGKEYCDTRG